jgi:hypothetical protein
VTIRNFDNMQNKYKRKTLAICKIKLDRLNSICPKLKFNLVNDWISQIVYPIYSHAVMLCLEIEKQNVILSIYAYLPGYFCSLFTGVVLRAFHELLPFVFHPGSGTGSSRQYSQIHSLAQFLGRSLDSLKGQSKLD